MASAEMLWRRWELGEVPADRLEEAIERELENTDVVIHVEPDHKAKRKGAVEL